MSEELLTTDAVNAFLVRFSDAVLTMTDPHEIAQLACQLVAETLAVERAYWSEVDWDTREYVIGASVHQPGVPVISGRFPIDAWEPFTSLHLAGRSIVVDDTQADERVPPEIRAAYAQIAVGADLATPVAVNGQLRGTLAINQRLSRHWTAEEVALVRGIASRCWAAVDQARTAVALRASEARYRLLFAAMAEGYCRYRVLRDAAGAAVDMEILEANPAYERLMQRPDPIGKRLHDVEPALSQDWLNALASVASSATPQRFERYNPTLDRWFDIHVTPVPAAQDEIVLVFNDMTERKKAEAALRTGEERQAFLLQVSDALRPLQDAEAIRATATALLLRHFAAGWCYFVEWDEAAMVGVVLRDATRDGLPSLAGVHDVSDVPEFLARLRSGQALIVHDYASYELLSPRIRHRYTALGFRSMVGVPLVKEGQLVALLLVGDTEPREWSATDAFILEEIAERTWATLQRARAEDELRDSEERYRSLFITMDQGFCAIEKVLTAPGEPSNYRYLAANPAFVRHTGLADPVGKTTLDILPDVDQATMMRYDEVIATREPITFQTYVAPLARWLEAEAYPGQVPGQVAVLFTDITERKRAEEAIRESEERQRFLLRLSDALRAEPDPEAVADRAIRVLIEHLQLDRSYLVSYRLEDDRADLVHQVGNATVPPLPDVFILSDYPEAFRATLDQTLVIEDQLERQGLSEAERQNSGQLGMRAMVAATLRHGPNKPLWSMVAISSRPRHWTRGEIALIEEVAERTWAAVEQAQAETALRESERRFRLIVDQATDYAIFSTDAERRIETWGPGAAAVFGWTAEEAVGQLMDITFIPADRAEGIPEGEFAQARDTGHAPDVRWHQRKDGSFVFIEGDAYARRDGGGVFQGVFKIGQDITARLAAEDARREAEAVRREEEFTLREELEVQVREATAELRTLSRRLLQVQEEERRNLALELHDEIGQVLTGLTFQLAAAQGKNGAQALAEAQTTVRALTEQVRQMALDLRPQVLDRYGLLAALEWHINRFQAKTGITVHLRHQGLEERFPPEVEIAAFRVVQEALTNVARHSGATFATVQAHGDGTLTLVIRDAGRGFDPAQGGLSTGLGGMRERVELLGGRLEIEAMPGGGTAVIAELPGELAAEETP